jgi:uncharacterized protein YjbI with pentapeptide repeats
MANPEHVAKLKADLRGWNKWRSEHPEVEIDLSGADFTDAILSWSPDPERDQRTNLRRVNAANANFTRANLDGVDLSQADLSGACLLHAKPFVAIMKGAKLNNADLSGTLFHFTDLEDCDFSGATLGMTVFAGFGLKNVKGLETVKHVAPSTIGIDVITRSSDIPEAFIVGTGIPKEVARYIKSLVVRPMDFHSCFISYSSKDDAFATELHNRLQGGNIRCWFAPEDLKIGDMFQERIEESIRTHDKLLLVLSENSINSSWVEREVQAAFEKERLQQSNVLFPVRLDDAVMDSSRAWAAEIRRTRHIGDFRRWKDHNSFQSSLDRLLRDLGSLRHEPDRMLS